MWIIDRDCLEEDSLKAHFHGLKSRVGKTSHRFDPEKFAKAQTVPFRLLDDDGTIYYEGRMTQSRLNATEEHAFAPLDWAMADAGCTELQYCENGQWQTL